MFMRVNSKCAHQVHPTLELFLTGWSSRQPATGKDVWVAVHTKKYGQLGNRILRQAGIS
jgi:hypothetical protein